MTGKLVLMADDEPVVLRVLRLQLEKAGYVVETVPNGEAALERLRDGYPDVLITDIEMPRMTGEELCRRIEIEFPDRGFPIFVATSLTGLRHREWTQAIADLHLLEKPLSARKLLTALNDYFASTTSTSSREPA